MPRIQFSLFLLLVASVFLSTSALGKSDKKEADPGEKTGFELEITPEIGGGTFDQDANLNPGIQTETPSGPSKWSLNSSTTYASSSVSEPGFSQNVDSFVLGFGGGYKLLDTLSISTRLSGVDSRQRTLTTSQGSVCTPLKGTELTIDKVPANLACKTDNDELGFMQAGEPVFIRTATRDARFTDASAGVNWDVKGEDEWPGVYVSGDITLIERSRFNNKGQPAYENFYGKSWSLGAGVFRSIDPVVLSLNLGYSFSFDKKYRATTIQQGHSISVQPSINFSVNSQISLNAGLSIARFGTSTVNGETQGIIESSVQLQMGVSHNWSEHVSFSHSLSTSLSGENSASYTFSSNYRP